MKKILTVILILVILSTVLTGCQRSGSGGSNVIRVGFAQAKSDESDWRMANTRSMLDAFNRSGFSLTLSDSNNDLAKQVADVQSFIDQEFDYIVIAAVNMEGWDTVLRNAQRANIPVILVDRTMDSSVRDMWLTWVGPDFHLEGVQATDWMERTFGNRQLNIVHLQGQLGASAQVERSRALAEGVTRNANWTMLAQQTGNWSTDTSKQIMTSWIQQFGSAITLVYAENDNMAVGAIQALQEAGMNVGLRHGGVAIISFDANRWALDLTLQGLIDVNVECNPLHGPAVLQIIESHRRGVMPPKETIVEEEAFFAETITQEIIDRRHY